VPRWGGDGNFLPIIAQTKAITQTLGEVRELLAEGWPADDDGDVAGAAHTAAAGDL